MKNYNCLEIWEENGKFYKKTHDDTHSKGGEEIEISEGEFNGYKNIMEPS